MTFAFLKKCAIFNTKFLTILLSLCCQCPNEPIAMGVDLSKILGGARSGQSTMTDDIIGVSVLRNTYKLVRFLYSAVHTYIHVLQQLVLQSKAKIYAFLQLPASQLIFSATWIVLILALKIIVLREMT